MPHKASSRSANGKSTATTGFEVSSVWFDDVGWEERDFEFIAHEKP